MMLTIKTWRDPVPDLVRESCWSFDVLSQGRAWGPALMVVFAAIDQLVWLDLPENKWSSHQTDFEAWVAR